MSPIQPNQLSFSSILEQSINLEKFTRAWCSFCKKYEKMTQKRVLREPPYTLNLNTNVVDPLDLKVWLKDPHWLPKKYSPFFYTFFTLFFYYLLLVLN